MARRDPTRRYPLTWWAVGVPAATVVAFVLHHVGLPWAPTWALCLMVTGLVLLAVALHRGARGPERSPLDRREQVSRDARRDQTS